MTEEDFKVNKRAVKSIINFFIVLTLIVGAFTILVPPQILKHLTYNNMEHQITDEEMVQYWSYHKYIKSIHRIEDVLVIEEDLRVAFDKDNLWLTFDFKYSEEGFGYTQGHTMPNNSIVIRMRGREIEYETYAGVLAHEICHMDYILGWEWETEYRSIIGLWETGIPFYKNIAYWQVMRQIEHHHLGVNTNYDCYHLLQLYTMQHI